MFKIRSYSKQELAMLYFPDADPHVATNRLASWIRQCRALGDALSACHLSKKSKFFTPKQVALIVDFLGEP